MLTVKAMMTGVLFAATLGACSAHANSDDRSGPGVVATGTGGERHYAVSGFDKVALGGTGEVAIRTGQAFGLSVTGDAATLDTLRVTRKGDTLGLGFKPGTHWSDDRKLRWTVTMPHIAAADIGGSGSIHIDRVDGNRFDGNIGGSGGIDVAAMKVDHAAFAIGGSGDIAAAGSARSLELSVGGSGKLRTPNLAAETATISIAGAGGVEAMVRRQADVTIVGSGDVTITGGARCSVTKVGVGTVHCG